MLHHPYLATAIVQLPFCDATEFQWCSTMATDGHHIFFDRDFCEQISEADTVFVIAHELLHVVLGHVDRKGSRDHQLWNVATDLAINLMLSDLQFTMASGGLFNERWRGFTAEQIYESMPKSEAEMLAPWRFEGEECATTSSGTQGDPSELSLSDRFGMPRQDQLQARGWSSFDDHLNPEDPRVQVVPGVQPVSKQERAIMRTRLAREMTARMAGRLAGAFADELEAASKSEVPWSVLLSHFVSGIRQSDYRMYPFNRKHLWRGLYLPSVGVPGPEHLVIAVDTSGSMDGGQLRRVMAELDVLRAQTECVLTVVQFDVNIQRVDRFDAWEPATPGYASGEAVTGRARWHGRGGTDIRAPFNWLESDEASSADAIIVMTDGYGEMPKQAPPIPTLWISMPGSNVEYPFGAVIRLGSV